MHTAVSPSQPLTGPFTRRRLPAIFGLLTLLSLLLVGLLPAAAQDQPAGSPPIDQGYSVGSTYQPFERGFMTWRADTGMITVFYEGGIFQTFPVWSYGIFKDNPVTTPPPPGKVKPIFGFGKLWGTLPYIREALGWATGSEVGYTAFIQFSPTWIVTLPPGSPAAAVILFNGGWEYSAAPQPTVTPALTVYDVPVSYQPFERGFMIWLSSNGQIYSFYGGTPADGPNGGSGTFATFNLESYGALPPNPQTMTPPFNRYHPIMGFGRVWWNFPTVRSGLGWAMTPEQGYNATLRFSHLTLLSITAPDGREIAVNGGGWTMPRGGQRFDNEVAAAITPTPTPTLEALPTATADGVEVRQFTADVVRVDTVGPQLHAFWDVAGVERLELQVFEDSANPEPTQVFANLPLQGSQTINVTPFPVERSARLVLWGWRGNTVVLQREIYLAIPVSLDAPVVQYFVAGPPTITDAAQTLQLSWSIIGADQAILEFYRSVNDTEPFTTLTGLPSSAEAYSFTLPGSLTGDYVALVLWGVNVNPDGSYNYRISSTLTLPVMLSTPISTGAAYQRYEGGFMLWRADTGEILVFYDGGRVEGYALGTYEPLPVNPITEVPPGYVLPINGFGKVWGNFERVREGLKNATAAEQGYTLTLISDVDAGGSTRIRYSLPDGSQVTTVTGKWSYGG